MTNLRSGSSLLSKVLRISISILPLAGDKIQNVPIIWPPLGSVETYAAGIATATIALFAALPALLKTKSVATIGTVVGLFAAALSLVLYANFLLTYVKSVETPHNGTQYRTIGSQRTVRAQQLLPNDSDGQLLEQVGLTDGDIERAWTPDSVKRARLELFASYVAALASINFALGAFARGLAKKKNQK
jgi:hypothetical protein